MKQLSIIIPIYNVEKYIRTCLKSVFRQNINEDYFEVILVNDGTKDNSIEVINDIINKHNNIIVLEQENQGLSAARNTGLAKASGKYILFLDSDDMLVDNTIPNLLQATKDKTPDLIVADFIKMPDAEITNNIAFNPTDTSELELTGKELFANHLNPRECYVWRTLYRRTFLTDNNIQFIPGIYFEDVPFTTECYLKANKCVRMSCLFYIYRQREASICSSLDIRKIYDLNTIVARLCEMHQQYQLPKYIEDKLEDVIFATFSITQWYIIEYDNLYQERKLLINDFQKKIPQLRFNHTLKQKIIIFFFHLMPYKYLLFRRTINGIARLLK